MTSLATQLHVSRSNDPLRPDVPAVRNGELSCYLKKPDYGTGFWTSTWRPASHDSAWVEWCRWNSFGDPYAHRWHLLEPKHDARLYVISGATQMAHLLKSYPFTDEVHARLYGRHSAITREAYTGIDFERMSQDYDGMHLTEEGNDALHLALSHNMNSWDTESCLWFRWVFTSVTPFSPMKEQKDDH